MPSILALNGLRGFAALVVIFSHTSGQGMYFLPGTDLAGVGKSGVFMFFILSAFLLISQFNHASGNILDRESLIKYSKRRFFRIYPFYTLYLLVGLISTASFAVIGIMDLGVPFTLTIGEFIKHMLLIEGKGVTWSIAVEFKFYFVLPVLALALIRLRAHSKYLPYLLLVALFIVVSILSPQSDSLENDARLLPYIPVFLIGALLAELQVNAPKVNVKIAGIAAFLGVVGLCVQIPAVYSLYSPVEYDHFAKNFIQYSICWALIMYCAINYRGILSRIFENSILQFFGALSFSIYLIHPIWIGVVSKIRIDTPIDAWIVLALSTGSAYLAYRFIEIPSIDFGRKNG